MISCDKHDYIEIACTYRLKLELNLKNGAQLNGTALDIQLNDDRDECLLLLIEASKSVLVVLDQLTRMRALSSNPHFDLIRFS